MLADIYIICMQPKSSLVSIALKDVVHACCIDIFMGLCASMTPASPSARGGLFSGVQWPRQDEVSGLARMRSAIVARIGEVIQLGHAGAFAQADGERLPLGVRSADRDERGLLLDGACNADAAEVPLNSPRNSLRFVSHYSRLCSSPKPGLFHHWPNLH